jgi:single-strand DNA-binding protein
MWNGVQTTKAVLIAARRNTLKCVLIGNLGRDAELRTVNNGSERVAFSVADNVWHDGKNNTVWYNVTIWNPTDFVKNLKKGAGVMLLGEFFPRTYTNKDGQEAISYDVKAYGDSVSYTPGRARQESGSDSNDDVLF